MVTAPPRLLCIGDLGMDHVLHVPHLPGRDEKIGGTPMARGPGGMAANVAVGATRLGTPARLVAAAGGDAMGREALDALRSEGVDVSSVTVRPDATTFYCVVLLDESGEKALIRAEGAAFLPVAADLSPAAFDGIAHAHLIHTETELFRRAQTLARQVGATLSLDLEATDIPADGDRLAELVAGVDILFLGTDSRAAVEARLGPVGTMVGQMAVTTCGARGAELEWGAHKPVRVAGHPVRTVDTLGAGDAFAAAFLHLWLGGHAPRAALDFANAAGAIATLAYGAQTGMARADAVKRFLAKPEQRSA